MKVAVVGAGIFGCTAAIYLARAGHTVHLYDSKEIAMQGASGRNQFRLHLGYHYPRAPETVQECHRGLRSFVEEYEPAVMYGGNHYYAIAEESSKTDMESYQDFLIRKHLPYGMLPAYQWPKWLQNVGMVVEVTEGRLNPGKMLHLLTKKLVEEKVETYFNFEVKEDLREEYDQVVVAAYSNTNAVLETLGCQPEELQYEVCEKPILNIPAMKAEDGVVIMDGPFCSVDPVGKTGNHLMGHVEHAIWKRSFGTEANIPEFLREQLADGMVPNPKYTRWPLMREAGMEFIPALEDAHHIGSMFVVRAVLPNKDDTDERPTLVDRVGPKVLRIFAGKIPVAVDAGKQVVSILDTLHEPSRSAA